MSACSYLTQNGSRLFPLFLAHNKKRENLLLSGFCSIYSTLSGIEGKKYPTHGLTMQTKQCYRMSPPLFGSIVTAARYERCPVLHSSLSPLFSLCSDREGPKLGARLQKCVVCFLHSSIQASPLIRLTSSEEKKK